MRVLVLSSVFPNPTQPALGVFVRERMRRVAEHCELVVVAPIPWFPFNAVIRGARSTQIPEVEQQDGLRVYHPRFFCVPRYLKWLDGLFYACSLLRFLRGIRKDFPFELIDAHFAYPDGMAAVLLGRALGCPVVITLRGSLVRLSTYALHRPQLRFALSAAARVLAVSESLKRVAVDLGIPADKIRVIPNGVDTERFFPRDRMEARQILNLPVGRTILLSIGGITEGKGHHRVLGILPSLLRHHPDLLYVIVGSQRPGDAFLPVLDRLIHRHGLQAHVLIAGERRHEEIPLWIAAADVLCLATQSEGWANVLLEALACGRPVVTTRVGGNPEIITNGHLGVLVPFENEEALACGALEALGRRWDAQVMVAHAKAHSWETTAHSVVEEFRRIVPRYSSGPHGRPGGDPNPESRVTSREPIPVLTPPPSDATTAGRDPSSLGSPSARTTIHQKEEPCGQRW